MTNTEADQSGTDPAEGADPDEHHAARQSLGRNVLTTLAAQVISWSSALVVVTMLPRYLGPEQVGQLRVATAIWLVAGGFIIFGTDKTITLQIARSEDEIARIVASAIRLRLLLWVVAAIVIALSLTVLQVDPTLGILAAIVGAGAIGTVVGSVGISSLQGLENFGSLAKVTSTMSVISLVSVVTAISLDVGLIPIACLLVMGEFINGALQFYFLRRFARLRWRTTWANVRATARRGLPYLLGGVALILYREADTMVMATLVDDEQIGWYTTADRLFGTALVVPTVLMTTMLPVLARVHADDPGHARRMAEQTYRTLLLIGLPAGIGLALISDRLALLLFGEEFAETGPVLGGFGLVLALVSITTLIGRYALAIGRERIFYLMLLTASIATVPLDLVLVPYFDDNYGNGAIGGAVSFGITESAILIIGTAIFIPTAVSWQTGLRLLKVLVATAAMAAVVYPLRDLFPLLPMAGGAAAFGVTTLLLRTLEEHEMTMVDPILARLGRPRHA